MLGVAEAGVFFGLGPGAARALVRQDRFPVPTVLVGSRTMVRLADLCAVLGVPVPS